MRPFAILTILAVGAIQVSPTLCAPSQEESRSMTTDSTKPEVPPKSECLHTKNRHRAFSTSDGFVEGGYVAEVALFADEGWYCSERGWVKSLKYCERHGPMMIRYTQHEESCKLLVLLSSLRGVGCLDKLLHCGVESGVAKLRDGKCSPVANENKLRTKAPMEGNYLSWTEHSWKDPPL